MSQLDESLARLRTDHVDLWLVHAYDDQTPLEETVSALVWAYESGRARYVGVANFTGWQVARVYSLLERAGVPLVADEVEYSLVNRTVEHEVAPAAAALEFGVLAWAPLGRGVLTGKYRHGVPTGSRATSARFPGFVQRFLDERSRTVAGAVVTAAEGLGLNPAAVALAWVRDRTSVASALVGARTSAQLREALSSEDVRLPAEIVSALEDVSAVRS
jgi:aryl-alcohol dehydrogenase-like predicted oxidoreductase